MLTSQAIMIALSFTMGAHVAESNRKETGHLVAIRSHSVAAVPTEEKLAVVKKYIKARLDHVGVQEADQIDVGGVLETLDSDASIELTYPTKEGPYTGKEAITKYLKTPKRATIDILQHPTEPQEEADGSVTITWQMQLEGNLAVKLYCKTMGIPFKTPINMKGIFKFDKPESALITKIVTTQT